MNGPTPSLFTSFFQYSVIRDHVFTHLSFQAGEAAEGQAVAPPEALEGLTAAVLVPPHRVSLMWTAWVFFKSFFSSLIPEGPQGMVN